MIKSISVLAIMALFIVTSCKKDIVIPDDEEETKEYSFSDTDFSFIIAGSIDGAISTDSIFECPQEIDNHMSFACSIDLPGFQNHGVVIEKQFETGGGGDKYTLSIKGYGNTKIIAEELNNCRSKPYLSPVMFWPWRRDTITYRPKYIFTTDRTILSVRDGMYEHSCNYGEWMATQGMCIGTRTINATDTVFSWIRLDVLYTKAYINGMASRQ